MSRKFKQHYEGFNRYILAEFMTEEELNELDKKYSEAKIERMIKKVKRDIGEKEPE